MLNDGVCYISMQMDGKYQHASIQLFIMGSRTQAGCAENATQRDAQSSGECGSNDDAESCDAVDECVDSGDRGAVDSNEVTVMKNRKLDDWEARRYGSIAARLLRDVKIT